MISAIVLIEEQRPREHNSKRFSIYSGSNCYMAHMAYALQIENINSISFPYNFARHKYKILSIT